MMQPCSPDHANDIDADELSALVSINGSWQDTETCDDEAADEIADWSTREPAPERIATPPLPTVAVRLQPPIADGSWPRRRISQVEVDAARKWGVPVCQSWAHVDLTSGLYHELGVVVLDGVSR